MIASAAARIFDDHAACRPRMAIPAPTFFSIMPLRIMPSALGNCNCRAEQCKLVFGRVLCKARQQKYASWGCTLSTRYPLVPDTAQIRQIAQALPLGGRNGFPTARYRAVCH